MNKKKIPYLILMLLLIVVTVFSFTACSKKTMTLLVDDTTVVYNGEAKGVAVSCSTGDVDGWTIKYINSEGATVDQPIYAGSYTVIVEYSKKKYETATATATLTIEKAIPEVYQWPTATSSIVYGNSLTSDMLSFTSVSDSEYASVPGTYSWVPSQSVSIANTAYDVVFTPSGNSADETSYYNNYATVKASSLGASYKVPVTVSKATPVLYGADEDEQTLNKPVVTVSGDIIYSGTTLENITLNKAPNASGVMRYGYVLNSANKATVSGSYRWGYIDDEGAFVSTAATAVKKAVSTYTYVFVPTNTNDVNMVQGSLILEIEPISATFDSSGLPMASTVMYGQTLASSTLSGGHSSNSAYGIFVWENAYTVPEIGTRTYTVLYHPQTATGEANEEFEITSLQIPVTVQKATVYFDELAASDVIYGDTLVPVRLP